MEGYSGYSFQVLLCLVGFFLILLNIIFVRNQAQRGWTVSFLLTGLLLIGASFLIGRWIPFQCANTIPDQIKIVGHVKGDSNSYLNNYLVILYRRNEEIGRAVTANGKFNGDRNDEQNDGYFEFEIPNTDQLSRCSMVENFEQAGAAYNLWWLGKTTASLWHNFTSITPGTSIALNKEEGQKTYTLIVLPASLDKYPPEINRYLTYLDENGNVVINLPIKTFSIVGETVQETPTGYFIKPDETADPTLAAIGPAALEVQDAWVADGSTRETPGPSVVDEGFIDIDNCGQLMPQKKEIKARIVYIHEVQFPADITSSYDLGKVALKANPSLGFTQGLVGIKEATEHVEVPARTHMKYRFVWQEQWKNGLIVADLDKNAISFPFRARNDMSWYLTYQLVDCP